MAQFIKTFLICLVLAFGFLGYKYYCDNSYGDLKPNENYSVQKPVEEPKENIEVPKAQKVQNETKQYTHTCYFYSPNGTLTPIKRQMNVEQDVEGAVLSLLKGPTIKESQRGYYSEIPSDVNLLQVKRTGKSIIIDLSSAFEQGGGSESIENRVKQLSKTVKSLEPGKDIYLYIEGKQVEYLGGEGVYIKQPLN